MSFLFYLLSYSFILACEMGAVAQVSLYLQHFEDFL